MIELSRDSSLHPPALSRHVFDRSIGMRAFSKRFLLHRPLDQHIRKVAHQLIARRNKEWTPTAASSIPKHIHQFWFSDDPLPDDLARSVRLVQQQHPEFQYTLWGYQEIQALLHELLGPQSLSLPQAILRDIAAAAVLWNDGGVAIDLEAECVHPITSLLTLGDCLIGFEPPLPKAQWKRRLFLSPSVLAARPHHPLIQAYLAEMIRRVQSGQEEHEMIDAQWVSEEALTGVVAKLGLEMGAPLLLGPTYFCPVSPSHIRHLKRVLDREVRRSSVQKILQALHITSIPAYSNVTRETIFVHMAGGRMSKEAHVYDPITGLERQGSQDGMTVDESSTLDQYPTLATATSRFEKESEAKEKVFETNEESW